MDIAEAVKQLAEAEIEKLILSSPKSKGFPYHKMTVRPLLIQKQKMYQLERFTERQAFQENIEPSQLEKVLLHSMQEEYSQLDGWSHEASYWIKISKKGKVFYKERKKQQTGAPGELKGQNREKRYLLEAASAPKPLVDLGVITKDGKVVAAKYDKYKQINRFIEMIDEGISQEVKQINIIDFGCGKSYLTFVLYHYLTQVRKIDAQIVGLDLKADVIEKCNQIAKQYGYTKLHFEVGNIEGYEPHFAVDMVISLHACDTATDFALYNAVKWNTARIYSVPCCQHELCHQMKRQSAGSLTEYGLLKERFAALLTDALRADMLRAQGYQVDLLEFVDMAHSPKNILIRAIKKDGASSKNSSALKRVEAAMDEYEVTPTLYRLLYEKDGAQ